MEACQGIGVHALEGQSRVSRVSCKGADQIGTSRSLLCCVLHYATHPLAPAQGFGPAAWGGALLAPTSHIIQGTTRHHTRNCHAAH